MRTTNPILTRLGAEAERERAAASYYYGQQQYAGQQPPPGYGPAPYPVGYGAGAPPSVRTMTVDDVVVRTIGLLVLTAVAAAAVWALTPPDVAFGLMLPAAIVGLVLGMVISFARVTNPVVLGLYAVVEGVFVGGFSLAIVSFTGAGPGIVMQAMVATIGVFLTMAFLYKSGKIRATPKFQRGLMGAMLGAAAVMLVNLVITLFTGEPTMLRDGGPVAVLVSLVFIVIAALSFVLSFHEVEEGVRLGLPEKYAWTCAFGILVSLVWLYLEVLRLISYFSGE